MRNAKTPDFLRFDAPRPKMTVEKDSLEPKSMEGNAKSSARVDTSAVLDDELYALTKRLKFGGARWVATVLDRVNELIAAGADLNQTGRPGGPLLAVVLSSNMTDEKEAVFRTILEQGADPKAPVSGLSTYLAGQRVYFTSLAQVAVSERMWPLICCRLITLLVKHGADLNAKTRNGCTALDIAMYRLWGWEERFDLQRTAGANGAYHSEMATGFSLVAYMPPFWKLVETVIQLGGLPSLWTEAQVKNCQERLARIHEGCLDAREEGFAKAEALGMDPEHYFSTTPLGDGVGSFARMDVGEPTPPPTWPTRKGSKTR